MTDCPLCNGDGGELLLRAARWRIVLAGDPYYPAFTRVIWQAHVPEMSDLAVDDRAELLDVVLEVERTLREVYSPDKINLASFGNQVPHLHWHLIARWRDDRHFPESVWGAPADGRDATARARAAAVAGGLQRYREALRRRLGGR